MGSAGDRYDNAVAMFVHWMKDFAGRLRGLSVIFFGDELMKNQRFRFRHADFRRGPTWISLKRHRFSTFPKGH